jgi:hypothetical protein
MKDPIYSDNSRLLRRGGSRHGDRTADKITDRITDRITGRITDGITDRITGRITDRITERITGWTDLPHFLNQKRFFPKKQSGNRLPNQ